MYFGVQRGFCDASADGNISPLMRKRAITPRTKAVVITHMWVLPCNMPEIISILQATPHILLIEDCSYAVGASIQGQMVGTFGDGAAWSLQGQKIISGGEGDIVLTKHADFHYRQWIWGNYNKRCNAEIPEGYYLKDFALTGAGLKTRAHPLAIVIARNQLRKLEAFQRVKTAFADRLSNELTGIPVLEPIQSQALGKRVSIMLDTLLFFVSRVIKHHQVWHGRYSFMNWFITGWEMLIYSTFPACFTISPCIQGLTTSCPRFSFPRFQKLRKCTPTNIVKPQPFLTRQWNFQSGLSKMKVWL